MQVIACLAGAGRVAADDAFALMARIQRRAGPFPADEILLTTMLTRVPV
jgi:hypothetical protein